MAILSLTIVESTTLLFTKYTVKYVKIFEHAKKIFFLQKDENAYINFKHYRDTFIFAETLVNSCICQKYFYFFLLPVLCLSVQGPLVFKNNFFYCY